MDALHVALSVLVFAQWIAGLVTVTVLTRRLREMSEMVTLISGLLFSLRARSGRSGIAK